MDKKDTTDRQGRRITGGGAGSVRHRAVHGDMGADIAIIESIPSARTMRDRSPSAAARSSDEST